MAPCHACAHHVFHSSIQNYFEPIRLENNGHVPAASSQNKKAMDTLAQRVAVLHTGKMPTCQAARQILTVLGITVTHLPIPKHLARPTDPLSLLSPATPAKGLRPRPLLSSKYLLRSPPLRKARFRCLLVLREIDWPCYAACVPKTWGTG